MLHTAIKKLDKNMFNKIYNMCLNKNWETEEQESICKAFIGLANIDEKMFLEHNFEPQVNIPNYLEMEIKEILLSKNCEHFYKIF